MISIMRLTIRIAVVLPQPDGPDEHADLAGRDGQREVVDGVARRAGVALDDVAELERSGLRAW